MPGKYIRILIVAAGLLLFFQSLTAQKTALFYDIERHYKKGMEFYEKSLFGAAIHEFRMAQNQDFPIHREANILLDAQARLMEAVAMVRIGLPEGEQKLVSLIRENPNNPVSIQALLEIANYHYNNNNHREAIRFYEMVEMSDLPESLRSEAAFKAGYSHFAQKEFSQAIGYFSPILDIKDIYYYPANYYYAMSQYFLGRTELALEGFQKVSSSGFYGRLVPYYIGAIYFAEGNFAKTIEQLKDHAGDRQSRYYGEINLLLGQSYFEEENYKNAARFLQKAYESDQGTDSRSIRYQLGFSHYSLGDCDEALYHLQMVSAGDDKLSQNANFYLADCFLRIGDKESARNAFANAMRADFNKEISEEAQFNYGKLSAELNYDREAVNILAAISPSSIYHAKAQEVLADVLLSSRDYARSIEIIESVENPSPTMRRAYQRVTFNRALQLFLDDERDEARKHLNKSLENPLDMSLRAQALFWKAEISHRNRNFTQSIDELNQYFAIARNAGQLPESSSIPIANYLQGYNYLKLERYEVALGFFQDAVSSIRLNTVNISDPYLRRQVLSDAMLRAGDCLFKNNRYTQAMRFYNDAIEMGESGHDYAIFQKGLILGLTGKPIEKIILLEDLVAKMPQSPYADDALLQMGITFQELGRNQEAVNALQRLITNYGSTSPLANSARLRLGLIYYNQGDIANAKHQYKEVFKNNPDKREAQDAMAALEEIYINDLGRPDDYFQLVESIEGIDFTDFARDSLSFRAAEMQYMAGNCERAIQSYSAYISSFQRGAFLTEAFYNRGECHSILRQWDQALNDYEAVLSRGQSQYFVRALEKAAAISFHHSEDFHRAMEHYSLLETRATNEEQRFEAQMGTLRSAYRIKHYEQVKTFGKKVIDNPRSGDEQKAAAWFFMAKMDYERKLYADALEKFNAVTRLTENVHAAEARYKIANIYLLQNEIELAGELARSAVQDNANYPIWVAKALVLLADILVIQGDTFNARAALAAVVEHFDEDPILVKEAKEKLDKLIKKEENRGEENETKEEEDGFLREEGPR